MPLSTSLRSCTERQCLLKQLWISVEIVLNSELNLINGRSSEPLNRSLFQHSGQEDTRSLTARENEG